MELRVGIPITGGRLLAAAREAGYPVLFSANAFFVPYAKGNAREGYFRKFKDIDLDQFSGVDAALDSAGFVAAARYGDYRWTPEQYIELAAAFPWAWYASMDYCCEPQVANDRPLRILRLCATAGMLWRLNALADERGIKRPMPILQGWTAQEYVESIRMTPLHEWPELVGIGSVCRRHLNGPDGLYAILDAIDRELPPHVKLHLFGVKSSALGQLAAHPRVASSDSMAWDFGARCERRTGRDMEFRIEKMHQWASGQREVIDLALERRELEEMPSDPERAQLYPRSRFGLDVDGWDLALEALAWCYGDLVRTGNLEYRSAMTHSKRDAYMLRGMVVNQGLVSAMVDMAEEIAGYSEHALRVAGESSPELFAQLSAAFGHAEGDFARPVMRAAA